MFEDLVSHLSSFYHLTMLASKLATINTVLPTSPNELLVRDQLDMHVLLVQYHMRKPVQFL